MSADLVPVVDATDIERAADPAEFVVQTLERAKSWLASAIDHGEIDRIVELKATSEAIRVYVMSRQLGKDTELSAAEIVRRAERGIGLAIRRGQESGTVLKPGQQGVGRGYGKGAGDDQHLPRPKDFVGTFELSDAIYPVTDGVTDDQFEAAIIEARTAGNLSRASVIRRVRAKREADEVVAAAAVAEEPDTWRASWDGTDRSDTATGPAAPPVPPRNVNTPQAAAQRRQALAHYAGRGYSSVQIGDAIGMLPETVRRIARENDVEIPADVALGRGTRKGIDPNRIVRETASTLDGLAMGVGLVDVDALDPAEIDDWVRSISTSIRALNRLIKQMKERTQ